MERSALVRRHRGGAQGSEAESANAAASEDKDIFDDEEDSAKYGRLTLMEEVGAVARRAFAAAALVRLLARACVGSWSS